MAYVNHDPSLNKYFSSLNARLLKLENAERFTLPNVVNDPSAPLHGDWWLNTTGNAVKYVDSTGTVTSM
jgi:hypothetical protein